MTACHLISEAKRGVVHDQLPALVNKLLVVLLRMRTFAKSTLLEMSFMYAASRHHLPWAFPCLSHWCPTHKSTGHTPRRAMEGTHHKIGNLLKNTRRHYFSNLITSFLSLNCWSSGLHGTIDQLTNGRKESQYRMIQASHQPGISLSRTEHWQLPGSSFYCYTKGHL